MSPKLFNAVLQKAFAVLTDKWKQEGLGMEMPDERLLDDLRFADDFLLVATTASSLESMSKDLAVEAGAVGPEIRDGKA